MHWGLISSAQNFCLTHEEGVENFLTNAPENVLTDEGPYTVRIFAHIIRDSHCQKGIDQNEFASALTILENDFSPKNIFVQDKTISLGNLLYAANTSITAGSNVTIPPFGNVDLSQLAHLEFKTHQFISLDLGFKAEPALGGRFIAHIDPNFCNVTTQINSVRTLTPSSYYPLLYKPKWITVFHTWFEGTEVCTIEDIGDTILNNVTYTIIKGTPSSYPGLQNTGIYTYNGIKIWREDTITRRIYQKSSNGGPDSLLYDFSLNIGDPFPGAPFLTLTNIDTVLTGVGYKRRFIFSNPNDSIIWVEGIGNIAHPLDPFTWFAYPGFTLICSYQNDTMVYDAGSLYNFNCTTLTTAMNEHQPFPQPLSVYPNPFNNSLTILINLMQEEQVDIDVFDALGNKISSVAENKFITAGKNELKYQNNFPAGIYLIKLSTGGKNYFQKICKIE